MPSAHRLLILLLILLTACSARKRIDPSLNALRSVKFEGNGGLLSGHNNLQLTQQMETEDTAFGMLVFPFMYFVEPKVLDPDLLPRDAYRLEVWYAHNGWFDAEVEGWQIRRVRRQRPKRAGVADLIGYVKPGPRSVVDQITITGMDRPVFKVLASTVQRKAYLNAGDPFVLEYAAHDRAFLAHLLHTNGFAYADVDLAIHADPTRTTVDVKLDAHPGISTHIGEITISGNVQIPDDFVQDVLPFQTGDGYDLEDLEEAQRVLFEMGTFSLVQVEPDLSDPTNPQVPVTIHLTESKWRSLRLGVGTDFEMPHRVTDSTDLVDLTRISPRLTTTFRHANLFGQLVDWKLTGSGGVDWVVSGDTRTFQEVWSVESSLYAPRVWGPKLALEVQGTVEQDVESGLWVFSRIASDVNLIYQPNTRLKLSVGPHAERYEFLVDAGARSLAAGRLFGDGFVNPYVLTSLNQRVVYDKRATDDAGTTTRGRFLAAGLTQAIPVVPTRRTSLTDPTVQTTAAGNFYVGTDFDLRGYVPIRVNKMRDYLFRTAFALRGEYLQQLGETPIPYPERAFLGGSTSIRGFRTGQVGPYSTICSIQDQTAATFGTLPTDGTTVTSTQTDSGPDGTPVVEYQLPLGGTISLQGSSELRYPWAHGITWAVFTDAGVLLDSFTELGLDALRYSAGAGVRYETPVGPVRFDVSVRPLFPEDTDPATCRGTEVEPHAYDLFSSFERWKDPDRHPPFALVFFLAIGEAI